MVILATVMIAVSALSRLTLPTTSTPSLPEPPMRFGSEIGVYQAGDPTPLHIPIAVVYEHRWGPEGTEPHEWLPIHAAIARQAKAVGADLVLEALSGDEDPRVRGHAKWFLGIAAKAVTEPPDPLVGCDNCVVDWLPIDLVASGTEDPDVLRELSTTAHAISRLRLGEMGYYLRERRSEPTSSRESTDPATLVLAIRAQRGRQPSATARELVISARLAWTASNAAAWDHSLEAQIRRSEFDYVTGRAGILTRNSISGVFDTLPPRGPTPDSDGDGVPDSRDREAETRQGAEVTLFGVSRDDDGDGVPNGIDRHRYTPRGVPVDQFGTPFDTDGDGVDDYRDACAGTPPGYEVDDQGCRIEITVTEIENVLVDEGVFQEKGIHFDPSKAEILARSLPRLRQIGEALSDLPALRFRVEGHCDDRGSVELNQLLSERRAEAVVDYLVANFTGISRSQFVARGFGKQRPIAPGTDELSRV